MKKITAIIKPYLIEEVQAALEDYGIDGLTLYEIMGVGRQNGRLEFLEDEKQPSGFITKLKVEIVLENYRVAAVVDLIARAAKTGSYGDGKIFIEKIDQVVKIGEESRLLEAV